MAKRQIVFVLGMHRSGTSALCAALESSGLSFGSNLLGSMADVNERGFWEDAGVVALNERILERVNSTWYDPPANTVNVSSAEVEDLSREIETLLDRDYGLAQTYAIKDPRLCITLPLWLTACDKLNASYVVCVISRAPLEVAQSLQKRDGFPLGYGLRLYARYWRLLQECAPPDALYITYDELLENVSAALASLSRYVGINEITGGSETPVKSELRHFNPQSGDPLLSIATTPATSPDLLDAVVAQTYAVPDTLSEMVRTIVDRGAKLTEVGQAHSQALDVIAQRDADIARVSRLHAEALATIAARDKQIAELNTRLQDTGEHLEKALLTLNERDRQIHEKLEELASWEANLQRVLETPVLNRLFYRMWYREER